MTEPLGNDDLQRVWRRVANRAADGRVVAGPSDQFAQAIRRRIRCGDANVGPDRRMAGRYRVVEAQEPASIAVTVDRHFEGREIDAKRRGPLRNDGCAASGQRSAEEPSGVGGRSVAPHRRRHVRLDALASALARRFVDLVGQSPIQYLAGWRMLLARDLLRESTLGIGEIAGRVGYDSEAAFNRAFRRLVGAPPATWREGKAAAARENALSAQA